MLECRTYAPNEVIRNYGPSQADDSSLEMSQGPKKHSLHGTSWDMFAQSCAFARAWLSDKGQGWDFLDFCGNRWPSDLWSQFFPSHITEAIIFGMLFQNHAPGQSDVLLRHALRSQTARWKMACTVYNHCFHQFLRGTTMVQGSCKQTHFFNQRE